MLPHHTLRVLSDIVGQRSYKHDLGGNSTLKSSEHEKLRACKSHPCGGYFMPEGKIINTPDHQEVVYYQGVAYYQGVTDYKGVSGHPSRARTRARRATTPPWTPRRHAEPAPYERTRHFADIAQTYTRTKVMVSPLSPRCAPAAPLSETCGSLEQCKKC